MAGLKCGLVVYMDKTKLDGFLSVMYYHCVKRNQKFDEDLSEEQIQEIINILKADGYITFQKSKEQYVNSFLCTLTDKGIQFCNEGGYKELRKKNRIKIVSAIVAIAAGIATIGAFIWQLLSK